MSDYASLFLPSSTPPAGPTPAPRPSYGLLFVDDEPNVLSALKRAFREENYRLYTAANGREALAILERETIQVIISDYLMPEMNGARLLREVRTRYPDTMRILLTAHADVDAVMAAVKEGAVYKFVLKPWEDDDLRVTVARALEQYDLRMRNRELAAQNERREHEIRALAKLAVTNRSQLAILLHKRGLLSDQQVQELYRLQAQRQEPVLRLLLERGWIEERRLREILRRELMIEEAELAQFQVDVAISALLPRSLCEKQWVVPLKQAGRRLVLAMADPLDAGLIENLRFTTGLDIQAVMADVKAIEAKINEVYGPPEVSFEDLQTVALTSDPYEGIEIVIEEEEDIGLGDLLRSSEEPPAIRLVNAILLEAIRVGASDVHIHPRTKHVAVRLRLDGILVDKIQIPLSLHQPLVSRIKVMAELDITERRRPQDGRLTVKTPMKVVDVRISTLPTINGEKVVMRLLDRQAAVRTVHELGLSPFNLEKVLHVVAKPQGIILATGPTGSGKTTTLYALLQHEATPAKNYVTIEDPVEYYLDMAGQVAVKERVGVTFASVLRAILRQDPDVILLGEIRDQETAEVAFHAALTGHLVYSTLHTNSALDTIARLFDLGLKPYVVATALEAVIAQRLVRRLCTDCREPAPIAPKVLALLGPSFDPRQTRHYIGKGCPRCHGTGYRGRLGLHEVLIPDEMMRHLIATGATLHDLGKRMRQQPNFAPLIEDARQKVDAGLTSAEEVLRVLGPQTAPGGA
ncbi:MAG: secretion system protein E [Azospira oryzae]|nr:MAG: secretion system protein E [Azospira oryzae]PZP82716.1 MAG: secretion system protein E [Azospira oryzae]